MPSCDARAATPCCYVLLSGADIAALACMLNACIRARPAAVADVGLCHICHVLRHSQDLRADAARVSLTNTSIRGASEEKDHATNGVFLTPALWTGPGHHPSHLRSDACSRWCRLVCRVLAWRLASSGAWVPWSGGRATPRAVEQHMECVAYVYKGTLLVSAR